MRALVVIALLALSFGAGCVGSDEQPAQPQGRIVDDGVSDKDAARPAISLVDPIPTKAALRAKPDAALRKRLDAGAVALVDLNGRMGIRPPRIDFAKDARLLDIEWQRWDDRGAVGRGQMVGVYCDPDCGRGQRIAAPATITLSKPVACPRGRFFDGSKVDVEGAADDPAYKLTSWLAAPC
jgi:hypothetical protein